MYKWYVKFTTRVDSAITKQLAVVLAHNEEEAQHLVKMKFRNMWAMLDVEQGAKDRSFLVLGKRYNPKARVEKAWAL